jgi:hypothetical protein
VLCRTTSAMVGCDCGVAGMAFSTMGEGTAAD